MQPLVCSPRQDMSCVGPKVFARMATFFPVKRRSPYQGPPPLSFPLCRSPTIPAHHFSYGAAVVAVTTAEAKRCRALLMGGYDDIVSAEQEK